MTAWIEILDEFEARLVLAEAVLELGTEESPPPFVAPRVAAGPLPPILLERASDLLGRARLIETRLVAEQERIRSELAALRKAPARTRPGATRFSAEA